MNGSARIFPVAIAETETMGPGEDHYKKSNRAMYVLPDEAEDAIELILKPYDNNPILFFDQIDGGRPPLPWAFVCLDKEYRIAEHVLSTRIKKADVGFIPYFRVPNPIPANFVPGVGTLCVMRKEALGKIADTSPLWSACWEALADLPTHRKWVAFLEPLPTAWVQEASDNG
jgi:hypothetical protein